MIAAVIAALVACRASGAPLTLSTTDSFPLEQPDAPYAENFPGPVEPLYGQTPLLRFVHYGVSNDRAEVLKRIRYARDYYRHSGLLVSPEERVYEVGDGDRGAAEGRLKEIGLWRPGRTVMFSTSPLEDELGRVLGAGDSAAMRTRYAFPPPKPATDAFHRPAAKDYRLDDEDRRAFELGLADAEQMSAEIYPGLIPKVDAVLFDTESLEIYSFNHQLALPKARRWRGYQVYRVARHARPEEHEMAICAGGIEFMGHADFRAAMGELYFACAGWGFAAIFPILCSVAGKKAANKPQAGIAAVTATGYFGFLVGPPIIGFLAQVSSLRVALLLVAALSGVGSAMAGIARPPSR